MNIQIFGTQKSNSSKKAIRFFKERNLQFHFVDLKERAISKGELNSIKRSIDVEDLIDKDSKEYKKNNLNYIQHNIEEKLLENPLLFKTPIVRIDNNASVGYDPDKWKNWINKD